MGLDPLEEEAGFAGSELLVPCGCGGVGMRFAVYAAAVAGDAVALPGWWRMN